MLTWLLVAHVVVLGYWLGSEFVINATFRYVCYATDTAFEERSRLMDHVMHVDQHVRYALVLQATLGAVLSVKLGYVPGGTSAAVAMAVGGGLWLAFVELVHRLRFHPSGAQLAFVDRALRYLLMAVLLATALGLVGANWPVPIWLRWKIAAFACVIACGVGIRIVLIDHFRIWNQMAREGVTPQGNERVKRAYWRSTAVLLCLWFFIAAMVYLSVAKPA